MAVISLPDSGPTDLVGQVAAEVRSLAGRYNVTQERLAAVLGISQPAVSKKWRAATPFTLREIATLAEFFNVDASELVGGTRVGPRPGGPDGGLHQSRGGSMDTRWYPYQNVA